jgi:hypothetical protein
MGIASPEINKLPKKVEALGKGFLFPLPLGIFLLHGLISELQTLIQ